MTQLHTMSGLRARVRRRIDMETAAGNPEFVENAELDQYIQKSYEKLYNYLVGKYEDFFVAFDDLTALTAVGSGGTGIEAGEQSYLLPDEFFKLLFIGIAFDGMEATELKRAHWRETGFSTARRGRPTRYHLAGIVEPTSSSQTTLTLYPSPDAAYTAGALIYVPRPPTIPESTGGVDLVAGWDEFVVLDACIKCRDKAESDTRVLQEEREDWRRTVEQAITPRDAGQPAAVIDTMFDADEDMLDDLHG